VEVIEIWGIGGENALKSQETYRENEKIQYLLYINKKNL